MRIRNSRDDDFRTAMYKSVPMFSACGHGLGHGRAHARGTMIFSVLYFYNRHR